MRGLSIVLAEDEPFILRSISRKIQSIDPQSRIVASTGNGKEALEAIRRHQPDLLCTDIRMPVLGGLELIKKAKSVSPELKVIIISGYNDFAYARQAIEFGVSDYLLKPVKTADLRSALQRVQSSLESSTKEEERNAVLAALRGDPGEQVRDEAPYADSYVLMLAHVGHLDNSLQAEVGRGVEAANAAILRSCDAWQRRIEERTGAPYQGWMFGQDQIRELALVLRGRQATATRHALIAQQTLQFLSALCQPYPLTLAGGPAPVGLPELASLRRGLADLIREHLVPGKPQVLWMNERSSGQKAVWSIPPGTRKELGVLARLRNNNELKKAVLRLFAQWQDSGCPQLRIERNMLDLFTIVNSEHGFPPEAGMFPAEQRMYRVIAEACDLPSAQEGLWQILQSMLAEGGGANAAELAARIKACLDRRFTQELSLQNICDELKVSNSTASKAFRRCVGVSPIEYLTGLRLGRARELLRGSPELSAKEIGEMVGYADPHYFYRVFKRVTGASPAQYRRGG